jgi:hypothetical protein
VNLMIFSHWLAVPFVVGNIVGFGLLALGLIVLSAAKTPWRTIAAFFLTLAMALTLAGCAVQPPPPVIVQAPPPKPHIVVPDDPLLRLRPEVQAAIKSGSHETLQIGITTIPEYSPDTVWTVNVAPMHAVDFHLAPDENTDIQSVILGDPSRWSKKVDAQVVEVEPAGDFGGHVDPTSGKTIPADPHMETSLTIATSRRRYYHIILRMKHKGQSAVEWFYPDDVKQQQAARALALKEAAKDAQ